MKTVILRELQAYLHSRQFLALMAISLILFGTSGLISSMKYKQQAVAYQQRLAAAQRNPSTIGAFVYPSPSPLRFLAEGGDKALPYGYLLTPMGVIDPLPSNIKNIGLPDTPELDWAFLVKIIFSLYAILMGYGAVAGEKEEGTLRLSLSNSLGRTELLTAKAWALLIALWIPMAGGMLLSLLITGINIPSVLQPSSLVRVLMVFIMSMLFVSVFVSLTLLFSSLINSSSLVLFLLLVVWVFLVVIIPNASGIAAQYIAKAPSEYQVSRTENYSKNEIFSKQISPAMNRYLTGTISTREELLRITDNIFIDNEMKRIAWELDYRTNMRRRVRMARSLTQASPVGLFQFALESVACTGTANETRFLRNLGIYSKTYDNYIRQKVGKLVPQIKGVSSISENGTVGGVVGGNIGGVVGEGSSDEAGRSTKSVHVSAPIPEEYHGDKTDFPVFVDIKPPMIYSLKISLSALTGLLIWNITLTLLAFGAFIRSDVR